MYLEKNNEIIGTLILIKWKDNHIKLIISNKKEIWIPQDSFSRKKFIDYLNKKVGILRIENEYFIREIREG